MARKDRHTFRVARIEELGGASSRVNWFGLSEAKCDQFFSSTLWGEDRNLAESHEFRGVSVRTDSFVKGLILAQNERWRRGLGMQVERAWLKDQVSGVRVSKATATNPMVGHSRGKLRVIPSDVRAGHPA
jgi:hypothetical protein